MSFDTNGIINRPGAYGAGAEKYYNFSKINFTSRFEKITEGV
jgi:hypothetical protein